MSFITATPREQFMLPLSIEEYVCFDHFVRFLDAFVEKVIKSRPDILPSKGGSSEGRPSYPPGCLIKLLIYGYLNRIASSRRLENETKRNMEVIWLMSNLQPDHKTISDFRKDNKSLIKHITIEFRRFLKDSGYIKGESISIDGTKIKANASRSFLSMGLIDKKVSQIEKELERYFSLLSDNDAAEAEQEHLQAVTQELQSKIARLEEKLQHLESQKSLLETLDRDTLAPTDPQAQITKTKDGFLPGYNVQSTVDNRSHLILTCQVADYPNDYHLLEENLNTLKEQLDLVPHTCVADGGYANEQQVQRIEKRGIECVIPFQDDAQSESKKRQRDLGIYFSYDQQADRFICSQGKALVLVQRNILRKQHYYNKYQSKDCSDCPKKQHCTKSKTGRIIYRRIDDAWLQAHQQKQKTKAFKEKYKQRKNVVEHPFGTMKLYMGFIPLLLRGKQKVQVEIDLYATAYNLTRLKNMATVPVLLEKLTQWRPIAEIQNLCRSLCLFFEKNRTIRYSQIN